MFKYIYTYILKHLFYFYYQLMNTEFYVPLTYILLKTNKPKLYKKKIQCFPPTILNKQKLSAAFGSSRGIWFSIIIYS